MLTLTAPALLSDVTILHDKKPQPGLNYGRIKRAPRLPLKKGKSTDSSSSSEGEDSSCGEDEAGEQEELLGAEESGEEDKKEVCIQVKVAKEEKGKPSLERPSGAEGTNSSGSSSSWDPIRATRQNQDIQREIEDTCMLDIQGHLLGKRKGKLMKNNNVDVQTYGAGGSFLRLEQVRICYCQMMMMMMMMIF